MKLETEEIVDSVAEQGNYSFIISSDADSIAKDDSATTFTIDNDDVKICGVKDENVAKFAGIANMSTFDNFMKVQRLSELLLRAVNNRTRERNYFRIYSELLEGELSEDEFDKEIDTNGDNYVIPAGECANMEDIGIALKISPSIKDVPDVDEMASLFSFSHKSIQKAISDGRIY